MQQPPAILYHYTSAEGLLGILSTNCIWGTQIQFLNDSTELSFGVATVNSILKKIDVPDEIMSKWEGRPDNPFCFVASFCEEGDLLSQWRGYTSDATGYSLGFRTESLSKLSLRPVVYDAQQQEKLVIATLKGYEDVYDVGEKLFECAASFKHPTFSEEREWRILDYILDWRPGWGAESVGMKFRASKRFIIPYVEFHPETETGLWKNEILKLDSLRFGPTDNPVEASDSLESLLWTFGYRGPRVLGSEVPLRM